jgi:hypothetical protein
MKINHQFLDKKYFFPNWKIKTLFIGTFNPECGETLDYYYRRKHNGFWSILNKYNSPKMCLTKLQFDDLKKFMVENKFGCVDVIKSISFLDENKENICGKGYSDSNLFTVKGYNREYNFEEIKTYVKLNKVQYVFSTWGKRCKPKEFRMKIEDFQNFCSINGINFIHLDSPSGRIYKQNNKENINSNWWENLDKLFNSK